MRHIFSQKRQALWEDDVQIRVLVSSKAQIIPDLRLNGSWHL